MRLTSLLSQNNFQEALNIGRILNALIAVWNYTREYIRCSM